VCSKKADYGTSSFLPYKNPKQAVLRTNEGSKQGASSSVQMDERLHPSAIAKKPV
jgi:hypothetical protein